MIGRLLTHRGIPVLVAALTFGAAGAAQASTVSSNPIDHSITITAASGETNVVVASVTQTTLDGKPMTIQIDDSNPANSGDSPITPIAHKVNATGQCAPDPNIAFRVNCTDAQGFTKITASLGDKDDYFSPSGTTSLPPLSIDGGDGNDVLKGSGGADTLIGGAGDDDLYGRGGADTLKPGTGGGEVWGGTGGPNNVDGEIDTVDFSDRTATQPVKVSLDGIANDGDIGPDGTVTQAKKLNVESDVENVIGGAGNDVITGNDAENNLQGGAGDDTISGLGGIDTIAAGDGNDTVIGGLGADKIDGGNGTDTISYQDKTDPVYAALGGGTAGTYCGDRSASGQTCEGDTIAGAENLTGGSGDDHLVGDANANVLDGGAGNDLLEGLAGTDTVNGGAGNDTLSGGDGDDSLNGGAGNDVLQGDAGADDIVGGDGEDSVSYSGAASGVSVTLDNQRNDGVYCGDRAVKNQTCENDNLHADIEDITGSDNPDTLVGSDAANTINGLGGDDVIKGAGGADSLFGGAGNDFIDGGAGADDINGGDGSDTVSYADRTDSVNVTMDGVADDGVAGEGDNVQPDMENVISGSGNDVLRGNEGDNFLDGGAGNDQILGMGGNDTVQGGAGDDTLDGGLGTDTICGYVCTAASGDVGTDTVVYDRPAGETVFISLNGVQGSGVQRSGYAENDTIRPDVENVVGGAENDVVDGSSKANTILVGNGDNVVRAGAGDDVIRAGSGNDYLDGGAGDDTMQPGLGADQVFGDAGNDTVDYSERTAPVQVTFDDIANDGEAGEGDNVASDVEFSKLPQPAAPTPSPAPAPANDTAQAPDQTSPDTTATTEPSADSSSTSAASVNTLAAPRSAGARATSIRSRARVVRTSGRRTVLVRGRILVAPRGGTAQSASSCTGGGMVRITITKGKKVVGRRFASVSKTCAFRMPITLAPGIAGKLKLEVAFLGNRVLQASRHTTKLQVNG